MFSSSSIKLQHREGGQIVDVAKMGSAGDWGVFCCLGVVLAILELLTLAVELSHQCFVC